MHFAPDYRAGFVCIVGRPNVGKSTLMNRLIGQKLSIVSPKPQTTRQSIKGIFSDERRQIILLDTPGFLQPRYELQERMLRTIRDAFADTDAVMFITDAGNYPTDYDAAMCIELQKVRSPRVAVLNKTDTAEPEKVAAAKASLRELGFSQVFAISALHDETFAPLLDCLTDLLPLSPPLYDPEDLSDAPLRFFAQEIVREQIFLQYRDEIPYSSAVTVERYTDLPNKVEIHANIWLERDSQKSILLGADGASIKALRMAAERELYRFLGKRARLFLWVKVKKNWRKKKGALAEFGYS